MSVHVIADHASKIPTLRALIERQHVVTAKYVELHEQKTVPAAKVEVFQQSFPAGIDYQNGVFAGEDRVIGPLTGQPPMSVETFIGRNRARFE